MELNALPKLVALRCRQEVPLDRCYQVVGDLLVVFVQSKRAVLFLGIALRCRFAVPNRRPALDLAQGYFGFGVAAQS